MIGCEEHVAGYIGRAVDDGAGGGEDLREAGPSLGYAPCALVAEALVGLKDV